MLLRMFVMEAGPFRSLESASTTMSFFCHLLKYPAPLFLPDVFVVEGRSVKEKKKKKKHKKGAIALVYE
uniref:Ovule protein n=1 Tax=Caenorhabditis tropicalis TaxID=1561998 RepID=A0A1I7UL79_9PELO